MKRSVPNSIGFEFELQMQVGLRLCRSRQNASNASLMLAYELIQKDK